MSFFLVAAPAGSVLRSINNGTDINLAALPTRSLTVTAVPATRVGSLKLQYDLQVRTDNSSPYSVAGDANGVFTAANLSVGTHTLTVTPYPKANLGGTPGPSVTITFTVSDRVKRNPTLLTAESSDQAIALNAATFVREPFSLLTEQNFGPDKRTRVMLFVSDLELDAGDTISDVLVTAQNSVVGTVQLPIEYIGKAPFSDSITQIELVLPDGLNKAGDVWITVSLHGITTNQARLGIKQAAVSTNVLSPMNLFGDAWLVPGVRLLWPAPVRRQDS
jgi:uncharacterized protein (TIGR03437 family)